MILYGLIGKTLTHSFSAQYFESRFRQMGRTGYSYRLFPLEDICLIRTLIDDHPELAGLNVTLPYKKTVMPMLDRLDRSAEESGAVNTIAIQRSGNQTALTGYNTDGTGFILAYGKWFSTGHRSALILGTGGAAVAVAAALKNIGIRGTFVSRRPVDNSMIGYDDIDDSVMDSHTVIVQATPVGMVPGTSQYPDFPYGLITPHHLVIDLIYNPEKTLFLQKAEKRGAIAFNGLEMLKAQAELSWEIWKTI